MLTIMASLQVVEPRLALQPITRACQEWGICWKAWKRSEKLPLHTVWAKDSERLHTGGYSYNFRVFFLVPGAAAGGNQSLSRKTVWKSEFLKVHANKRGKFSNRKLVFTKPQKFGNVSLFQNMNLINCTHFVLIVSKRDISFSKDVDGNHFPNLVCKTRWQKFRRI